MPSLTRSFGLMDLVACAAVAVTIASLSLEGWRHAKLAHTRTATVFNLSAVLLGLEEWKTAHGDYPTAVNPELTGVIDGKTYRIGAAAMLYQVCGQDGTNEIAGVKNPRPSNGKLDDDGTLTVAWSRLVHTPENWRIVDGHYILVDLFGRPFQYEKGGTPNAINQETFDAWSAAEDSETAAIIDKAQRKDPSVTARWIKNF